MSRRNAKRREIEKLAAAAAPGVITIELPIPGLLLHVRRDWLDGDGENEVILQDVLRRSYELAVGGDIAGPRETYNYVATAVQRMEPEDVADALLSIASFLCGNETAKHEVAINTLRCCVAEIEAKRALAKARAS